MTNMIHMDRLIYTIDTDRPIIEWFAKNERTLAGKQFGLTAERHFQQFSTNMGGGKTPAIWTQEKGTSKTALNDNIEFEELIRYLAAANRSGLINLCPHSTPECRAGCLGHTSGRLRYNVQQKAQQVRTAYLALHPTFFHIVELREVARNARRLAKKGKRLAARINGTSDIPYERIAWYLDCLALVGMAVLFDYTADQNRERGWVRHNGTSDLPYHLTHSTKEGTHPNNIHPGSYTVVPIKKGEPLPATYNGYPVFDGDSTDLRFLDPEGHVTLGRAKGALKKEKGDPYSFVKPASHTRGETTQLKVKVLRNRTRQIEAV